jgi:hypothetical protein
MAIPSHVGLFASWVPWHEPSAPPLRPSLQFEAVNVTKICHLGPERSFVLLHSESSHRHAPLALVLTKWRILSIRILSYNLDSRLMKQMSSHSGYVDGRQVLGLALPTHGSLNQIFCGLCPLFVEFS